MPVPAGELTAGNNIKAVSLKLHKVHQQKEFISKTLKTQTKVRCRKESRNTVNILKRTS